MKTIITLLCLLMVVGSCIMAAEGDGSRTVKQRIIGYRINGRAPDSTFIFVDSGTLAYSANRGDTFYYNRQFDIYNMINQRGDSLGIDIQFINTRNSNGDIVEELERTWVTTQLKDRWRTQYTYDNNRNVTKKLRQTMQMGVWVDNSEILYEYDTQSRQVARTDNVRLAWGWQSNGKKLTIYDNAGDIVERVYLADSSGTWDTSSITYMSYNTGHQLLQTLTYDVTGNSPDLRIRESNVYDGNGNLLSWHRENLQNGNINSQRRLVYTYNAGSQKTSELYLEGYAALDSLYLYEWTYGNNDSVSSYTRYTWYNGVRTVNGRSLYTYTGNLLSEILYQGYDSLNWFNGGRDLLTYDAYGYLDLLTRQTWVQGGWENNNRQNYNCNVLGNVEYILKQNWESGVWVNTQEEFRYYEYYDDAVAIKPLPAFGKLMVYPNPVTMLLLVDFNADPASATNLTVYNITGQPVLISQTQAITGSNHVQLDVSELCAGSYFIEMRNVNGVACSRFIKQ